MIFDRVADTKIANHILKELKIVPKKALNIINESGTRIYCFNKDFKPSWIGFWDKDFQTDDGRLYDETSCYVPGINSIFIYGDDLEQEKDEAAFSTIIHELGHALDFALGNKLGIGTYISCFEPGIIQRWKNGKALDYYGGVNNLEYFAEAFMAYCYKGLDNYKSWSYREHTASELKDKDNDMFFFLKAILKGR